MLAVYSVTPRYAERALERRQHFRTRLVSVAKNANAKSFPVISCLKSMRPCHSHPGSPCGHTMVIMGITMDEYESGTSNSPYKFAFRAWFSKLEAEMSLPCYMWHSALCENDTAEPEAELTV